MKKMLFHEEKTAVVPVTTLVGNLANKWDGLLPRKISSKLSSVTPGEYKNKQGEKWN